MDYNKHFTYEPALPLNGIKLKVKDNNDDIFSVPQTEATRIRYSYKNLRKLTDIQWAFVRYKLD